MYSKRAVAPLRVRELKLKGGVLYAGDRSVAPLRVRELKQTNLFMIQQKQTVAPLRVRELKLNAVITFPLVEKSHLYGCVN